MELEQIVSFVQLEKEIASRKEAEDAQRSIEEKVDRGEAVADLELADHDASHLFFRCEENTSRLRVGDRVACTTSGSSVKGVITAIQKSGCHIEVRQTGGSVNRCNGSWSIRDYPISMHDLILSCLDKVSPGRPGWSFAQRLLGNRSLIPVEENLLSETSSILHEIANPEVPELDRSQRLLFGTCLSNPKLMGVQGPPGTGKTNLLAHVAVALSKRGNRVLVVGPTHQSVNNCLSMTKRLSGANRVVKVGDELMTDGLDGSIVLKRKEDGSWKSESHASSMTITGMTFVMALLRLVQQRSSALAPHVLLIDEAGQLPLSYGICAGLVGPTQVILFGDDMQLPPIFDAALINHPPAVSVFQRLRSVSLDHIRTLSITHRMNRQITKAVGNAFYSTLPTKLESAGHATDRRLISERTETRRDPVNLAFDPDHSLVWLRTHTESSKQTNLEEAKLSVELIREAAKVIEISGEIAVVTPYRKQVALIRKLLSGNSDLDHELPIIDTVERLQGATAEIVVISMVLADRANADNQTAFLLNPRRFNVAMSRARSKVVLLAHPNIIQVAGNTLVGQALRYFSS